VRNTIYRFFCTPEGQILIGIVVSLACLALVLTVAWWIAFWYQIGLTAAEIRAPVYLR